MSTKKYVDVTVSPPTTQGTWRSTTTTSVCSCRYVWWIDGEGGNYLEVGGPFIYSGRQVNIK